MQHKTIDTSQIATKRTRTAYWREYKREYRADPALRDKLLAQQREYSRRHYERERIKRQQEKAA